MYNTKKIAAGILVGLILTGCEGGAAVDSGSPEYTLNQFCTMIDEGKMEEAQKAVDDSAKPDFDALNRSWDEVAEILDTFDAFADVSKTVHSFQDGLQTLQIENIEILSGKLQDENTYDAEIELEWLEDTSVYNTFAALKASDVVDSEKALELQKENNNIAYNYIYKTMYDYLNENLDQFKQTGDYTKRYFDVVLTKSNDHWVISEISEK